MSSFYTLQLACSLVTLATGRVTSFPAIAVPDRRLTPGQTPGLSDGGHPCSGFVAIHACPSPFWREGRERIPPKTSEGCRRRANMPPRPNLAAPLNEAVWLRAKPVPALSGHRRPSAGPDTREAATRRPDPARMTRPRVSPGHWPSGPAPTRPFPKGAFPLEIPARPGA